MTARDDDGKCKGLDFQCIVDNMPLVTVIPEGSFFSEEFFPRHGPLPNESPKIGIDWLGKGSDTRNDEEKCGLDDPEPERYFFAGRAAPEFGNMAFAYDSHIDARRGEATPFDTGLLGIHAIKPGDLPEDRIRALIKETTYPFKEWRTPFKKFLEKFFPENPRDYFHKHSHTGADWGPPDLPARQEGNKYFHAWTWEARIHEPHPLLEGLLFWTASRDILKRLKDYATQKGLSSRTAKIIPVQLMNLLRKFPKIFSSYQTWIERLLELYIEPVPHSKRAESGRTLSSGFLEEFWARITPREQPEGDGEKTDMSPEEICKIAEDEIYHRLFGTMREYA